MKKNILFSAALMFFSLASSAQTTITFDSEDYKSIAVYDKWEKSPFRTGALSGNAGVTENPDVEVDEVIGMAPNSTGKVLALQRSRFGSNTFGVRINLKEKPADSRLMVIGLGKRVEDSWNW